MKDARKKGANDGDSIESLEAARLSIRERLDKADEHLDKSEYPQAEALAEEVLTEECDGAEEARALCIIGRCCTMTGRYKESLTHYHKSLDISEESMDISLQAKSMNGIAWVQYSLGEHNDAICTAENALTLAESAKDKKQQGSAMSTIGQVNILNANYPRALENMARAFALAEEIGDRASMAGYLCNTGIIYQQIGDYSLALDYYSRALEIAEGVGHKSFVANILGNIGITHRSLADYSLALDYYARALTVAEEIGDKAGIIRHLCALGNVHSARAEYTAALEYYERSLAFAEVIGARETVVCILNHIGNLHTDFSDTQHGMEFHVRALVLAQEIGAEDHVAGGLFNIGGDYIELGNYPNALEYYNRSLLMFEQNGSRHGVGQCLFGIAQLEHMLGNLDAAYRGITAALQYYRDVLKTSNEVVTILYELGLVLLDQEKTEEGLTKLEEALALAVELDEKKATAEANKAIADAYAKLGDMAKAYEHLHKHLTLEKEIFSDDTNKRVQAFNIRVATEVKEKEAELQRVKIQHQERELALTASQLAGQSELLGRFRNDLREIVRETPDSNDALRKIKQKLKDLPCEQIDWGKFEAEFITVHPEFRRILTERYPTLTPQETKMCLLVRLDLKNAEIARLVCLSERSVEGHRLNLRKKLDLKKEQGLPEFLAQIK